MKRAEVNRRLQRLLARAEAAPAEAERAALADVPGRAEDADVARGRLAIQVGWLRGELKNVAEELREVLS